MIAPLTSVDLSVLDEGCTLRKPLLTGPALVGLIFLVNLWMLEQVGTLAEMFSTARMEVGLFTSMTSKIMDQRVSLSEALAMTVTVVSADIGSLTKHRFLVSNELTV